MQRLAQFEHDEIRHIDDVVDRALANGPQAILQPGGGWADANTADDARHITWASFRVLYIDPTSGFDGWPLIVEVDIGQCQRPICESRDLAGDAHDAQAIWSIR